MLDIHIRFSCNRSRRRPHNKLQHQKMALSSPAGPIDAETADNFEEIEKQFAVKGELGE